MTSEGAVLFEERQLKLCTVRVPSVAEPMNTEPVEPELTWSGVSTLLYVFRVLPYRTSSGARFRGLEPCFLPHSAHGPELLRGTCLYSDTFTSTPSC